MPILPKKHLIEKALLEHNHIMEMKPCVIHIFQRTYGDSGTGTLSEAVSANNQERRVGTIYLSLANNTSQHVYREMFPVWPDGGKFVVRFSDGDSTSTITVTAGWKMDYRPTSYGVSSS